MTSSVSAPRILLLTGAPGVGKTTLLRRLLAELSVPRAGFLTGEIREGGERLGFTLETLDGRRGILAHRRLPGPPRVGPYGVDLAVLDGLGTAALEQVCAARCLAVVDEIGKMECASPRFVAALEAVLAAGLPLLATIMLRPHPVADRVKAHPRARCLTVTRANREACAAEALALLRHLTLPQALSS
jgi:nucleoside-triphosphatase